MGRVTRAHVSALVLAGFLGALSAPLAELLFSPEPSSFCCAKGRCCCNAGERTAPERDCVRRACGCRESEDVAGAAAARLEAVLPAPARVSGAPPVRRTFAGPLRPLLEQPDAPLVPPPRRRLA